MGGTYHPGVLLGVGGVCGLGGEGDGEGGKVDPGQAQGGGTLRSFSPDPENEEGKILQSYLESKILVLGQWALEYLMPDVFDKKFTCTVEDIPPKIFKNIIRASTIRNNCKFEDNIRKSQTILRPQPKPITHQGQK